MLGRRPARVAALVVLLLLVASSAEPSVLASAQTADSPCQLADIFLDLSAAIGSDIVGDCLADTQYDQTSGNVLQATTTGLLVWRQADDSVAFTDGQTTWLEGPDGLQVRSNDESFAWEAPTVAQAPGPEEGQPPSGPSPSPGEANAAPLETNPATTAEVPTPTQPRQATPTPAPALAAAQPAVQQPASAPPATTTPPANTGRPQAAKAPSATPTPTPSAAIARATNSAAPPAPQVTQSSSVFPLADATVTVNRGGRVTHVRPLKTTRAPDGREAVADRIVVAFQSAASASDIAATHAAARAQGIGRAQVVQTVASNSQLVDISGAPSIAQALAFYQGQNRVRYALPDYVYRLDEVPNDPLFSRQWGMSQIKVPAAFDVTHGSTSRYIAIVDSGIYDEASTFPAPDGGRGHPDLRGKVGIDVNFSTESDTDDNLGHGTHVAGIAAAQTSNLLGVAGAGFLTRLLNVKVFDASGSAAASVVQTGIRWAADNGASVINLSLGAPGSCTQADQDAIDYAWQRNAVIVVAAGNDGTSGLETPASCQHVIAVASTDSSDTKSSFSTYGSWVQVAAPGGTDASGNGILSTSFDGNYVYMSGTSMATPHVSGVAALVWSMGFASDNQTVVNRILQTADPITGTGTFWQYGRLNAANAVAAPVCTPRPSVAVSTTPSGSNRLQVTISASGSNVYLQSIQFGNPNTNPATPSNALIDIGSQTGLTGSSTVALSGVRQTTFYVRRASPGGATTVPFIVTDSCGAWPSLVGGGASAF